MQKPTSSILIIGTQRSGSNMLRLMLNQLPEIEAPHPPHLLQIFFPLIHVYGDLKNDSNFKKLIDDICCYVDANPVPWSNVELGRITVFNRCTQRTLVEISKVVYELKAEAKGASYWCCKSLANVYFIPEIESGGLNPFYIHLIRDGRDVAASFEKAIVGEKHIYLIAKQWKLEQELALSMTAKYAKDRTTTLRYEEFIRNPKVALTPILERLGLEWSDEILNFYQSEEAKRTAAAGDMWRNVVKPVDSTNMRHYSERLTQEEILIFESVAGDMLVLLNYKLDNLTENLKAEFSNEEIASYHKQNDILKKEARLKYAKDLALRIPQENIISEIKSVNIN
ncbi:MAG: sulfotransferase [Bacteroidota bacterium]